MYTQFFKFKEKPFSLVPDPGFLFLSDRHEKALTFLEYGLSEKAGFIMLTGEIGMGKTTLIRHLLNQVDEQDTDVAVVFHTNVSGTVLLRQILSEFEVETDSSLDKAALLELLYELLIDRYARNRKVFLIVDEAQNLSASALEELRMLSNLQTDKDLLVQIIIVGQPGLRDKIGSASLRQFAQRISASFHLSPMTQEETRAYVRFRLERAGGNPDLFTPDLLEKLFVVSGGIPRTINLLCDAVLVYAFADRVSEITKTHLDQVIEDKGGMGVFTARDMDEPGSDAKPQAVPGLESRINELEERLNRLTAILDNSLAETESRATFCRDDLVDRLTRLYKAERKKTQNLIFHYSRLKEKYTTLLAAQNKAEDPCILLNKTVK
ncbi:MAG: general secretion pathway protein GspA [Desulfobacter postgatei]|uniref:General secretion pathway protein GspA n=1 Tax=Desulfobacter postgatei TaxID=2293 RepID=A0A2G6MRX7_9BACT|nr:MAG: general secretion pathway protein GspA [Desulfobacter postgatei]